MCQLTLMSSPVWHKSHPKSFPYQHIRLLPAADVLGPLQMHRKVVSINCGV